MSASSKDDVCFKWRWWRWWIGKSRRKFRRYSFACIPYIETKAPTPTHSISSNVVGPKRRNCTSASRQIADRYYGRTRSSFTKYKITASVCTRRNFWSSVSNVVCQSLAFRDLLPPCQPFGCTCSSIESHNSNSDFPPKDRYHRINGARIIASSSCCVEFSSRKMGPLWCGWPLCTPRVCTVSAHE